MRHYLLDLPSAFVRRLVFIQGSARLKFDESYSQKEIEPGTSQKWLSLAMPAWFYPKPTSHVLLWEKNEIKIHLNLT